MAPWRWSPLLWRFCRQGVSHRRLMVSASPRMGDTTWVRQRRPRPKRHPCKGEREVRPSHRNCLRPSVRLEHLCSTTIPMHRLKCSGGALRALASLRVCLPVCLHGETWLSSDLLQACHMLVYHSHLIRNLVHFPATSIKTAVHYFLLSIDTAVYDFT